MFDTERATPGDEEELRGPASEQEWDRLRFELYHWRERAVEAEAANAEWEAWRARRGWRLYMALLGLRARAAPAGSRRDRAAKSFFGHVLDLGAALPPARWRRPAPGEEKVAKAVVFVTGISGDSPRYRCAHQAEALGLGGVTFDVERQREVDLDDLLDQYQCYVLHRVHWGPDVERFIDRAHERGKRVIYDTDDLVFDPDATRFIELLEHLGEPKRTLFLDGLHRCRRTLEACDAVTVSSDFLADRVRQIHPRVAVAYNVVSSEMMEQADAILGRPETHGGDEPVTIAYLSGSPTHDRDFLEASDAVLWALETFPRVRFLAVGSLALDARFDELGARVERVPHQPWKRLPELLASVDVNLAPLEPENPFNESKSCLKYVEAGLLGVPTIASPRSDFARAIEDGVNGFLAEGRDAWREAMGRLVGSPELRHAIGGAARDDVLRNHTTHARSRALCDLLEGLAGESTDRPLSINWVVGPIVAGHPHGDALELAGRLAARGHRVRVYAESASRPLGPDSVELVVGHHRIEPADVTIATSRRTAFVVAAHERSLFKCLLVEGLEPELLDDGEGRETALTAYALPLRHVCLGSELADRLSRVTGVPADGIEGGTLEQTARRLEEHLARACFLRLPVGS